MANAELWKVLAGLECCTGESGNCDYCSYAHWNSGMIKCMEHLMRDCLEILREVESDGLY